MVSKLISATKMIACVVFLMILAGCERVPLMGIEEVTVIADLAYEANPHLEFTVFISENGEYVPYLVLTDNYNSNTLLLRRYLLDELRYYYPNPTGTGGGAAYYGDSPLGHFLNDEFFYVFSDSLQYMIINSDIEITARHSLRALADNELEIISRRVFLLSRYETGGRFGRFHNYMQEGVRLDFFSTRNRQIAHRGDIARSWWLRTPHTAGRSGEAGIICNLGTHGRASVYTIVGVTRLGVRPAFCLPNDTPVSLGEFNGEYVFFIDYNEDNSGL